MHAAAAAGNNNVFTFIIMNMFFRYLLKNIECFFSLRLQYIYCIYFYGFVRTSRNSWFWLFVSYYCVESGESLTLRFCDRKILFTNPSARAGYDTRSIFKRSLTGFNSEFSFSWTSCLNKAEEPSLSYYLPIAGGRIIGFIPFPMVLVLCEMQSVSSRIWTRVAVSNSYDDNHYSTCTSTICFLLLRRIRRIFDVTILWSEDSPSKEEYTAQLKLLFMHLMSI